MREGADRARRRRLERPREQVLGEAMAAIAEHGLARLTMAGLARRLDTSGGHILYYFGSKDQLLLETLRWSEDQLGEVRRAAMDRGRPAAERLDAFVDLYLPTGPSDPRWVLWLEVWSRSPANEEIQAAQTALDRGWRADLTELISDGIARGEFRHVDPGRYAMRLMSMLDGFSIHLVVGDPGADRDDVRRHVAEHVAEHLGAAHPGAAHPGAAHPGAAHPGTRPPSG